MKNLKILNFLPTAVGTLALALLLATTATAVLTSCQKPGAAPVTYGPEVSEDQVDAALNNPLAHTDPLAIQVGQFVDMQQTQNVGGQMITTVGEIGTSVIARDETDTEVTFTIVKKTATFVGGETKVVSTQSQAMAPKPGAASSQSLIARFLPANVAARMAAQTSAPDRAADRAADRTRTVTTAASELLATTHSYAGFPTLGLLSATDDRNATPPGDQASSAGGADPSPTPTPIPGASPSPSPSPTASPSPSPTPVKITFHNLQASMKPAVAPPDLVAAQPNCLGIPNCQISQYYVSFDMLVWNNPADPTKIHRDFVVSPDVPFFARLLNQCNTMLVQVQQAQTLVVECSPVVNFRWSMPTSP